MYKPLTVFLQNQNNLFHIVQEGYNYDRLRKRGEGEAGSGRRARFEHCSPINAWELCPCSGSRVNFAGAAPAQHCAAGAILTQRARYWRPNELPEACCKDCIIEFAASFARHMGPPSWARKYGPSRLRSQLLDKYGVFSVCSHATVES